VVVTEVSSLAKYPHVIIRVTTEEKQQLKDAAVKESRTLSSFVRHASLQAAQKTLEES